MTEQTDLCLRKAFYCGQIWRFERRPRAGEQRLHEGIKIITFVYNLLTVSLFLRSLFFAQLKYNLDGYFVSLAIALFEIWS